ncbi:MAG TPA: hypothetical protein P5307_12705 [Pirellulaceae bacterium]|nr:hypothetical protein [Pirellulaceae bacterium]
MRRFLAVLLLLLSAALLGCPLASPNTIEHGNVSFDVSPNGETIVFSDANGDLWLFALLNDKLTRLTESKESESWPSFSPDGKSVIFVKDNENGQGMSVYQMIIDSREMQQITSSDQCSDSQPVFSPDGSTIAFSRSHLRRRYSMGGWTWDKWDVYTIRLDGSDLTRQTHGNHYEIGGLAFSANAKHVYFTADEIRNSDSKATLFTITLDDSSVAATKPGKAGDYYAWCTDPHTNKKDEMVFISDRNSPFQYDVVFAAPEGPQTTLGVTTVSQHNQNPVVTNDGRILFLAGTAWNSGSRPIFSLWSVNVDGTATKQLAGSALFTNPLEWARQQNH